MVSHIKKPTTAIRPKNIGLLLTKKPIIIPAIKTIGIAAIISTANE